MVFHSGKNRHGANAKQPDAEVTFTDIPDELLLYMLHQTDITAVLRLRATSRCFVPACTEVIRDKLKILYVHPSPSSVQRAIRICESDLSSDVEEICFVSQTPWAHDTAAKGFDLPWPLQTTQNEEATMMAECEPGAATFGECYKDLLSSLAGLERLQAFSFQESCDRPGLNMVSAQRLSNWVKTIGTNPRLSKERRAENALYAVKVKFVQPQKYVFANINAAKAVLNHPGINFTRLKLGHELLTNRAIRTDSPVIVLPQTLTRLDLLVTGYWKTCEWYKLCSDLLRSTAPTLLELKLGIRSCRLAMERDDERCMRTLAHLLIDTPMQLLDLPNVERLEFYSAPSRRSPSQRSHSGLGLCMIQWFDLETFLAHSCSKLLFFRLTDIIPIRDQNKLGLQHRDHTMMQIMHSHLGVQVREITGPGLLEGNAREWEVIPDR